MMGKDIIPTSPLVTNLGKGINARIALLHFLPG
jgi:hypothetical protein